MRNTRSRNYISDHVISPHKTTEQVPPDKPVRGDPTGTHGKSLNTKWKHAKFCKLSEQVTVMSSLSKFLFTEQLFLQITHTPQVQSFGASYPSYLSDNICDDPCLCSEELEFIFLLPCDRFRANSYH